MSPLDRAALRFPWNLTSECKCGATAHVVTESLGRDGQVSVEFRCGQGHSHKRFVDDVVTS
jgi:hypothetical protein